MTSETEASLSADRLLAQLEALLIISEEPLSVLALATALGQPQRVVSELLAQLRDEYDGNSPGGRVHGFELRDLGGRWRVYARREHDDLLTEHLHTTSVTKLSQAALETLAVVAYKQPMTRSQMAAIRAVNVDSVVRTLVGRGLLLEVGVDDFTGAILYGTSQALLDHLGIDSLDDLPPIAPLLDDGSNGFSDLLEPEGNQL